MSFGKSRTQRFVDPLYKAPDSPGTAFRSSISRTSLSSQRTYRSPRNIPIPAPRSRSLNREKSSFKSSTNISIVTTSTAGKSKLPIQISKTTTSPAKNVVAKGCVSPGDRHKKASQSNPPSPVPATKSAPSTPPAKAIRTAKLQQNVIPGVKSNPTTITNATTGIQKSNRTAQTGLPKNCIGPPNREALPPKGNKNSFQEKTDKKYIKDAESTLVNNAGVSRETSNVAGSQSAFHPIRPANINQQFSYTAQNWNAIKPATSYPSTFNVCKSIAEVIGPEVGRQEDVLTSSSHFGSIGLLPPGALPFPFLLGYYGSVRNGSPGPPTYPTLPNHLISMHNTPSFCCHVKAFDCDSTEN